MKYLWRKLSMIFTQCHINIRIYEDSLLNFRMNYSLMKNFASEHISIWYINKMILHTKNEFTYNYIMTVNQASREELLRHTICCICPNVRWICIRNHNIKIKAQHNIKIYFSFTKITHDFNSSIQILLEKKSGMPWSVFSHNLYFSFYLINLTKKIFTSLWWTKNLPLWPPPELFLLHVLEHLRLSMTLLFFLAKVNSSHH